MASKKKVAKLHVKKGDMVVLTKRITSSKNIQADREAGYQGKILKVFPETGRVIVEGVNLRYRHTKPNQLYPEGGRIEREAPIHASNVMPIDSNGQRTRIGRRLIVDNDTGQRRWMRYAKTDGQELDS